MSSIRMLRDAQSKAVKIIQDAALMGEPTLSHDELSNVDDAVRLFGDAIEILAEHKRQAKARRERIQWVDAPNGVLVAKVGRGWAHYICSKSCAVLFAADGKRIAQFEATSVEGASRKIRAWRKKQ